MPEQLAPPEWETTPEPSTRGGVEAVASEAQRISHDVPRGLFGSRWRRDVPTLCINGSMDQFFGRRNSVSETVVKRASDSLLRKGDRPHITGDAGHRMAELGMTPASRSRVTVQDRLRPKPWEMFAEADDDDATREFFS